MQTKVEFIREEVAKLEAAGLPRDLAAAAVDTIYTFAYAKGREEAGEDNYQRGFNDGRESMDEDEHW